MVARFFRTRPTPLLAYCVGMSIGGYAQRFGGSWVGLAIGLTGMVVGSVVMVAWTKHSNQETDNN